MDERKLRSWHMGSIWIHWFWKAQWKDIRLWLQTSVSKMPILGWWNDQPHITSYFCSKMSTLPAETSDDLDILARRDAVIPPKGIKRYHVYSLWKLIEVEFHLWMICIKHWDFPAIHDFRMVPPCFPHVSYQGRWPSYLLLNFNELDTWFFFASGSNENLAKYDQTFVPIKSYQIQLLKHWPKKDCSSYSGSQQEAVQVQSCKVHHARWRNRSELMPKQSGSGSGGSGFWDGSLCTVDPLDCSSSALFSLNPKGDVLSLEIG